MKTNAIWFAVLLTSLTIGMVLVKTCSNLKTGLSFVEEAYLVIAAAASLLLIVKVLTGLALPSSLKSSLCTNLYFFAVVLLFAPLIVSSNINKPEDGSLQSEFLLTKQDAVRWSLLNRTEIGKNQWLIDLVDSDPGLAVVGLELELEKHIKTLGETNGINRMKSRSADDTLMLLVARKVIQPYEYSIVHELLSICRSARNSGRLTRDVADIAVCQVGIPIINQIDSHRDKEAPATPAKSTK